MALVLLIHHNTSGTLINTIFILESNEVLFFGLRPSTSSIAIGLAVNFASGSSEKFDNFGKIPIAKPFFERIYRATNF